MAKSPLAWTEEPILDPMQRPRWAHAEASLMVLSQRVRFPAISFALVILGCHRPVGRVAEPAASRPKLPLRTQAQRLGLRFPLKYVFLRALKQERTLELWAANAPGRLKLVATYPIAAASGGPGPKRQAGDLQVPEGVYRIDRFNPRSRFHLSLGLDYPNASDRRRSDSKRPGSDIFIHGNRVSIGCMAMTDAFIDEIYPACRSAINRKSIAVHVFPCRMDGPAMADLIERYPQHREFWRELRPIYDAFESTHRTPRVRVTSTGVYRLVR